jgi:hypothetical protein
MSEMDLQKELSSIHRWVERNHADGFIDSLTYLQNLERVTDSWYERIDRIEMDAANRIISANTIVDKANELIARWDAPSWKDTAPTARFINALRIAVRAYEKQKP